MKDLNFEKALKDLETTVEKLEQGDLSLDESLKHFEKGVKLARFLRKELEKAEKKVEILLKDEEGKVSAESFEAEKEKDLSSEEKKDQEDPDNGEDESLPF